MKYTVDTDKEVIEVHCSFKIGELGKELAKHGFEHYTIDATQGGEHKSPFDPKSPVDYDDYEHGPLTGSYTYKDAEPTGTDGTEIDFSENASDISQSYVHPSDIVEQMKKDSQRLMEKVAKESSGSYQKLKSKQSYHETERNNPSSEVTEVPGDPNSFLYSNVNGTIFFRTNDKFLDRSNFTL